MLTAFLELLSALADIVAGVFGLATARADSRPAIQPQANTSPPPPRPVNPLAAEGYEYRFCAEGEVTRSGQPTTDGKWILRHGIHSGSLVSRDQAPNETGHESFQSCRAALEKALIFWRSIGCYIWFAEAIAPDGTTHKLVEGAPYDMSWQQSRYGSSSLYGDADGLSGRSGHDQSWRDADRAAAEQRVGS